MAAEQAKIENTDKRKLLPVVMAWMFVGIPLLWGVSQTLVKALALFK